MNKIISWSRWIDAYGLNRNQLEYVPEKECTSFDVNPEDRFDFDEDDEEENVQEAKPVIVTPTGILPLRPFNNILNFYNFWLGETNFNISEEVAEIINSADGVEIFDILGRYKFRIAIGNCFKFQEVRQELEKQLDICYPKTEEKIDIENMELTDDIKEQVKNIIKIHLKKHKFWALYVLPNGKIDMTHADDESETANFTDKVDTYISARKTVGGAIFKSTESDKIIELFRLV